MGLDGHEPGTSQISVQVKDSLHEGQGEAGNMSASFP